MTREATILRETAETRIEVTVNLDLSLIHI